MARSHYGHVPGVLLIDGNVACLSMDRLRPILTKIREVFPESDHTNMFGTLRRPYPQNRRAAKQTLTQIPEHRRVRHGDHREQNRIGKSRQIHIVRFGIKLAGIYRRDTKAWNQAEQQDGVQRH